MFVLRAGTMLEPSVAAPLAAVDWFRIGHLYQIYSYSYSFLETQIGISKGALHLPWGEGFCRVGTQKPSAAKYISLWRLESWRKLFCKELRKELAINVNKQGWLIQRILEFCQALFVAYYWHTQHYSILLWCPFPSVHWSALLAIEQHFTEISFRAVVFLAR